MKKSLFLTLLCSILPALQAETYTPATTVAWNSNWSFMTTIGNLTDTAGSIYAIESVSTGSYANLEALGYSYAADTQQLTLYLGGYTESKAWKQGATLKLASETDQVAVSITHTSGGLLGTSAGYYTASTDTFTYINGPSSSGSAYGSQNITAVNTGSSISGNFYGSTTTLTGTTATLGSVYFSTDTSASALAAVAGGNASTSVLQYRETVQPFERTREESLGRVMYIGDSITHGIADQTHRWQMHKILVDNGIEYEAVGPRSGYTSNYIVTTSDKGDSYGKQAFNNVHLAQSSGRSYELVNPSNTRYGANTPESATITYNADTHIMLIGTNDLLSDTNANSAETVYASKMQGLLGGTVAWNADTQQYTWSQGNSWGNIGTVAESTLYESTDTLYLLSVPVWGSGNSVHSASDLRAQEAVRQYNTLLEQWVSAYNAQQGSQQVTYVEINKGLVDVTIGGYRSNDAFFRTDGNDYLHPKEQGSLLIAGNYAKAMGIGGRTAGQARLAASAFSHQEGTVKINAGASVSIPDAAFTYDGGCTVDFRVSYGNGADGGWSATDTLSMTIGNGIHSGTLNIMEGYVKWGDTLLYCGDMSKNSEALRVSFIRGNAEDNLATGYYVWMDDMMIGQGLKGTASSFNGLTFAATGTGATVTSLAYTSGSYAPETTGMTNSTYAYRTTPDGANESSNVFWETASILPEGNKYTVGDNVQRIAVYSGGSGDKAMTTKGSVTSASAWIAVAGYKSGATSAYTYTGNLALRLSEGFQSSNGVLCIANGGATVDGDVTVEVNSSTAVISAFSGKADLGAAMIGAFNGNITGTATTSLVRGTLNGDIIGGVASDGNKVGATRVLVSGGTVNGNIYGGNAANGTVAGNTEVQISGGLVTGNVYGGNKAEAGTISGSTSVTIQGNTAEIRGNISADTVTLRNVEGDGKVSGYAQRITAKNLVLDNVQSELAAALDSTVKNIAVTSGSRTALTLGADATLDTLSLDSGSSVGFFRQQDNHTAETEFESTILLRQLDVYGECATLNANVVMQDGKLNFRGYSLELGSTLQMGTGMELDDISLEKLATNKQLTLFTGVDGLIMGSEEWSDGQEAAAATFFTDMAPDTALVYSGGAVILKNAAQAPEPATGTLGLLALVGLAARRRRK